MYNSLIYLLDAFCLSLIISVCFKKSKLYLFLHTIGIWSLNIYTEIGNTFYAHIICILLVNVIYAGFKSDVSKKEVFVQVLLALTIREFAKLIVCLRTVALYKWTLTYFFNWFSILGSKTEFEFSYLIYLLNIVLAMLIYLLKFRFFNKRLWLLFSFVISTFLLIGNLLSEQLLLVSERDLYLEKISFFFIILFVLVLLYIIYTNKDHATDIKLKSIETQNMMVKNNLKLIESVSYRLSDLEHKINYVLLNLKYLIIKNNQKQAIALIENNLWSLSKHSYYFNTNNPYFDYLFAGVIKKLSQKNIKPIIMCDVQKGVLDKNIYLTSIFIDFIDQIYDTLDEVNKLQISIDSLEDYITLSFFIMKVNDSQLEKMTFNLEKLKENNVRYSLNKISDTSCEFKLIIFDLNKM